MLTANGKTHAHKFRFFLYAATACIIVLAGTIALVPTKARAACDCKFIFPTITNPKCGGTFTLAELQSWYLQVTNNNDWPGCSTCIGGPVYSLRASGLPAGLVCSTPGMNISGAPLQGTAGTYSVLLEVMTKDQNGNYCCIDYARCKITLIVLPVAPGGTNQQQQQQQQQTVIITPPAAPSNPPAYTPANYKYTINMMGLTEGATASVAVDGVAYADMTGGETRTLDGVTGNSYTVTVPSNVQGKQGVQYVITGSTAKTANANNPSVSFTYDVQYRVDFKTFPGGVVILPGSAWVSGGTQVSSSAPATVKGNDNTELIFDHWTGPGGESRYASLSFTANAPAVYTAYYNSKAIAQPCSLDLFWIIILALAIVIAAVILAWRRGKTGPTQVITVSTAPEPASAEEKPAPSEPKIKVTSSFCHVCGDALGPDEKYCDKCGTKRKNE